MRALPLVLLTVLYPFAVYLAIGRLEPRWLALLLVALAALRGFAARGRIWLVAAAVAVVLALFASVENSVVPLKLYPLVVNLTLLAAFALSLRYPPTVAERFARLTHPDLPPSGVAYTRRVTQVWCFFFLANGSMALATALWASDAIWALYNGMIAYLLIGALFAGEWLVRRRVRTAHG